MSHTGDKPIGVPSAVPLRAWATGKIPAYILGTKEDRKHSLTIRSEYDHFCLVPLLFDGRTSAGTRALCCANAQYRAPLWRPCHIFF